MISLALSVLEDVAYEKIEKEERKRLEIALKVLSELTNIPSEEKESVSKDISAFYSKMKKILSKEKNKEVKEELDKNKSIPSDIRKELGLRATSDNIV